MKQQTEKKLQANLKAINNNFNTVIFADIEVKFKLMELEAIRILIDDCEKLINEDIQCRDIELLYFKKFLCILQVME